MELSIIVPVYNAERYLDRCIGSLLSQDLKHYEIILVDDGSSDHSYEMMQAYQASNPDRIRILQQPNGGQGSARNLGIQAARGEFLTFVDSDDYVAENCYSSLLAVLKQGNYDILLFDALADHGTYQTDYSVFPDTKTSRILTQQEYLLTYPAAWNKIFRKDFWEAHQLHFPEGIWYEDLALIPLAALYTDRIYYQKQAAYFYVQSDNSIMRHNGFRPKWRDMQQAILLLHQQLSEPYPAEMEYLFWEHFLYETSLRYYQVAHYDEIDKIADLTKALYPHWQKNQYIKSRATRRQKLISRLFFHKKYRWIRFSQQMKQFLSGRGTHANQ